jgi:hypothetical protein
MKREVLNFRNSEKFVPPSGYLLEKRINLPFFYVKNVEKQNFLGPEFGNRYQSLMKIPENEVSKFSFYFKQV